MSELQAGMIRDAELLIDVVLSVEEDDVVTLVTDGEHDHAANALESVAADRGAWPIIVDNKQQIRRSRMDPRFPVEPPANLYQAMVNSDHVLTVTNMEWANRFAHVEATSETCENGGNWASVEEGMGDWNLTESDLQASAHRARDAMAALEDAESCRVTSEAGTDVRLVIDGRAGLEVTPLVDSHLIGPIPLWAEAAYAPVEDLTEGRIVIDGVMFGIDHDGQVDEPITWVMEGGRAVSIEGGEEAAKLSEVLDGVENADVLGEFAFGTSPYSPFGSPSEKGRLGTAHFALGANHVYPGGQNVSELHLDGVCLNASIEIEDSGRFIIKDGEWAL